MRGCDGKIERWGKGMGQAMERESGLYCTGNMLFAWQKGCSISNRRGVWSSSLHYKNPDEH